MSNLTYHVPHREAAGLAAWRYQNPPLSSRARIEAGHLLRRLQRGERQAMPHSRSLPSIGKGCHELRIEDSHAPWRVIYRIDADAIVILDVFSKKTQRTPKTAIEACRRRMKDYDETS